MTAGGMTIALASELLNCERQIRAQPLKSPTSLEGHLTVLCTVPSRLITIYVSHWLGFDCTRVI